MPQKFLSIKNFEKYQSFKHRNPPWFKIHKSMFGDREFTKLPPASRFLYVGLIYLAVESENKVYNDRTWIGQRLYMDRTEIDLSPLYKAGFLITSNIRRECSETVQYRDSTETVQRLTPVVLVDFDTFWEAYPKKVGKQPAAKAWKSLNPDHEMLVVLLKAIETQKASEQWRKDGGKFIPHPATWINGKRWEDELTADAPPAHRPPPFPPSTDPIARNSWRQAYGDPKEHGY